MKMKKPKVILSKIYSFVISAGFIPAKIKGLLPFFTGQENPKVFQRRETRVGQFRKKCAKGKNGFLNENSIANDMVIEIKLI